MASLELDDGAGGPNIGQYLADMVEFRPGWLKRVSPQHTEGVTDVTSSETSTWLGISNIGELQAAFDEGDAALRRAGRPAQVREQLEEESWAVWRE